MPTAFPMVWILDASPPPRHIPPSSPVSPNSWGPPFLHQWFTDLRFHEPPNFHKTDLSKWPQLANSLFCKQDHYKEGPRTTNYDTISKSIFQQEETQEGCNLSRAVLCTLEKLHDGYSSVLTPWFLSHFTVYWEPCHHRSEGTPPWLLFPFLFLFSVLEIRPQVLRSRTTWVPPPPPFS